MRGNLRFNCKEGECECDLLTRAERARVRVGWRSGPIVLMLVCGRNDGRCRWEYLRRIQLVIDTWVGDLDGMVVTEVFGRTSLIGGNRGPCPCAGCAEEDHS